jgi:8-oxo-dGTP pyrophosphatase MutT (NUDIX family)
VKLLLVDNEDRVLLIHAKDPQTHAECWYPVGGGVEPGESLQTAAAREAYEETGLVDLPTGVPVWRRDHRYEFDGQAFDVHEEWLLHRVERFEPAPAQLSDFETRTILGFRWWRPKELADTTETIFPPQLGQLLADLLADGVPSEPFSLNQPHGGASAVLASASVRGTWRGAVLPSSAGLVFVALGIAVGSRGVVIAGVAAVLAGLLRAAWWAKVCATSQLVDNGRHLVWMYRGERRAEVAWSDLRHVLFQRYARHVTWAVGPRWGGPFPYVLIDSRADHPAGLRHFAEILIIDRAQLQAADEALASACLQHRATYHGIASRW